MSSEDSAIRLPKNEQQNELDELLYVISHDFKSPIRHIREFSKLLLKEISGKETPKEKEYLNYLIAAGEKADLMLETLLQYSRINSSPMVVRPIDCDHIITRVLHYLTPQIQQKKVNITKSIKSGCVVADEHLLFEALKNVVDNAIKFHKNGSSISVGD